MAGVGALKRLFRTFLSLKGSCHRSEVTFYSDSDGDCHVTLRVTTPGAGFQSPCRGGAHSRSQERKGSGARNPPPPPAAAAPAPAPASAPAPAKRARRRGPAPAPAPAPARRARRRGPSALFRDERRRMARIEPGLIAPEAWEVDGKPALPLHALIYECLGDFDRCLIRAPKMPSKTLCVRKFSTNPDVLLTTFNCQRWEQG